MWVVARSVIAVLPIAVAIGASSFGCSEPPEPEVESLPTLGSFGDGKSTRAYVPCVEDPSFYDVPGDGCDNDADGIVDNPPVCDDDEDGVEAESFARGIGICARVGKESYGLVSATFTRGYGRSDPPQSEQRALLTKFGDVVRPREGKRLGVLSTGYADEFNGAPGRPFSEGRDWYGARPGFGGNGTAPPGYPKGAEGCAQDSEVNDVVNLHLVLKAPRNASGFAFDFNFHSGEWPAFVCSKYNDGFIAYLSAESYNGGKPENISFDAKGNPVSVNNGFFDRCTPETLLGCGGPSLGRSTCPGGPDELAGTGFGLLGDVCGASQRSTTGGATGWLFSQAPVRGGETFSLDLMIWDVGDGILDSSVLIDRFRWILGDIDTVTDRPSDLR